MTMDTEKQKNKAKNTPHRIPILKFLLYGFFVFAVVIILLIILGPLIATGFTRIDQPTLPDELYPTAEAIVDTIPIDERIPATEDVFLRLRVFGGAWLGLDSSHIICILSNQMSLNSDYVINSRLFVNGSRIWNNFDYPDFSGLESSQSYNKCVHGNLEPGLHLIEFHLRDSFFGAPLAIQQWAIEVE